jgi:hypothetical protein
MADINLNLRINYGKDPTGPLKQVQAEVKGLEGAFKKIGSLDVFKGAFGAAVAVKGLELLGQALSSVVGQFTAGIDAAKEAEEAQAAFAFAISDTEENVKQATAQFSAFADQLSVTTAFEDEAIIKSGALIGTLTRLSGEGLQNATRSAADLAAALGIDLEQAATLVGKAANGNVAAFGRLGVEIKKGNTDAETFANTLKALERFQGAAEAKSQTFAGAQTRLANTFGNLQEELGNTIVKNQAFVNAINAVQTILARVIEFIKGNGPQISEALGQGLKFVVDAIGATVVGLDVLARSVQQAFDIIRLGIQVSIRAILTTLEPLRNVSDVVANVLDSFDDGIKETSKNIDEAFTKETTLQKFAGVIAEVGSAVEKGIGQEAKTAADQIQGRVLPALTELSEEQKKLGQQGQDLAKSLLGENPAEKLAQQSVALAEARAQDLITEQTFLDALAVAQQTFRQKEAEALLAENALLAETDAFANAQKIADNQAKVDAIIAQEQEGSRQQLELLKKRNAQEEQLSQARLKGFSQFFGNLSALQKTQSAELFAIGKAAAIAQATIDGYAAAQGAYKVGAGIGGPILGAIFAAAAAAAAAVNISNIAATNLATGITEVPPGFRNDTFPANLSSGERVLSVEQNKDLKQFMSNGGGGSNEILMMIVNRLDNLENQITVNIGEKEVFNVLRDGVNSGRSFA